MSRRVGWLVVCLALAMTCLAGGIALAATRPSSGHMRAVVVFLGDSNETLPATEVADELLNRDYGYTVVNVARPGSTIRTADCEGDTQACPTYNYWQVRVADLLSAVHPDAWVVDLGINDTVHPGSSTSPGYSGYGTKIDWLLAKLGSARVYWTNLPCKIEPANRSTGCATVNKALAQARSRHANLRMIDWAGVANNHRDYLGPPNTFGAVHLTGEGRKAWAHLVATVLDDEHPQP